MWAYSSDTAPRLSIPMNDFVNRFSSAKPGEQGVEDVHELMQGMNPGGDGLPTFALPPLPDVGRIPKVANCC